jgi:hypothetical protein
VVHCGEQADLAAVGWAAGAAQGLAVDRDRPPAPLPPLTPVTVGQPGADRHRQCLVVEAPRVRRMVDSAGTVRWPVSASRRAPSAAGTIGGASAAHSAIAAIERAPASTAAAASPRIGGQRVAAPGRPPRVTDGGQVGEQVGALGGAERVGVTQQRQPLWDRG